LLHQIIVLTYYIDMRKTHHTPYTHKRKHTMKKKGLKTHRRIHRMKTKRRTTKRRKTKRRKTKRRKTKRRKTKRRKTKLSQVTASAPVPAPYRTTPVGPGGWYTRAEVEQNPTELYVFGENDINQFSQQKQDQTQAVIRGLKNAIGVRTCSAPGTGYIDTNYTTNVQNINKDFKAIETRFKNSNGKYKQVVFPGDGLGTGVAQLPQNAPRTDAYLKQRIQTCKNTLSEFAAASPAAPLKG
jgi:hypothetical protein